MKKNSTVPTTVPTERVMLVGVEATKTKSLWPLESSLAELGLLTNTAGAEVVGVLTQRLSRSNPAYYLGKGKVEELATLKRKLGYDTVVFDDELTPSQQRNLEGALNAKVIDRTALILDIFAKRARTREGQLQVELAQHQYLLPRLAGQWSHLERLGGGIGTRGPGETQLETDRRLIRRRIQRLKKDIETVRKHRAIYRRRRALRGIPVVALVGYTNAGKTTLFNTLCRAHAFVEDKLFATLDPLARRLALPDGTKVLLTDTVGFIQKLPTTVIAAFRATLEELAEADLLLHIVDMTHANAAEQSQTVENTLASLGLEKKPRLTLLNKIDLLAQKEAKEEAEIPSSPIARERRGEVFLLSAAKGWGLDKVLNAIAERLEAKREKAKPELSLPA
ncbi:MAG: GTPase HflX [Chloroflexi bacterium]|nr:GTPase HflX [Chloroflexota bacterium]